MTIKTILAFLLISLSALGQEEKFNCIKNLNKTPYFLRHNATEPNDSLQLDFDILKSCGKLDSIDSELLTGPMLGTIIIQYATHDKVITYSSIIKSINEFKKTDSYSEFREAIIASKTLENKTATIDGFEKDKEILLKAGLTQSELEGFKLFIKSNSSQLMTYKEAFAKYTEFKQSSQPLPPEKIEFNKLVDIESAIKTGKENGKKVLLYFSCYACVNARKVEDRVLTDNQVKSILYEKFNYFIAYTDDRSIDKATNSTVGKKNIKMQSDNFKTNFQPYFCIIDNDGKVLSEIANTLDTAEFIEFLKKGLK